MMRFWNRINRQRIKDWLRRRWRKFLATTRLDLQAVCEESHGMGYFDYHDYPDDIYGYPEHFGTLVCKRCGKEFTI